MELQFTTLNKITLTEQVMQQLASKIISGELKPGEKLPPERDLAEMLQVSRSRVREALRAFPYRACFHQARRGDICRQSHRPDAGRDCNLVIPAAGQQLQ